jgi:predicted nucleotide-binding protein (sugar kinase/HSP70/actin superfamily)
MVMDPSTAPKRARLPVISQPASASVVDPEVDIDAAMREFERMERERLGIKADRKQWTDTMVDPKVRKHERDKVTLLIGGLTAAQDFLAEGAFRGLGYKVEHLAMANNEGLQTGKEFGNRGQCNPTYYTVGGLVKHLIDLRDKEGMSTDDIIKNYVFFTAGACGPCRFGMYVTEYRKALRDAGFDGFRVMLFQQQGGLSQATGDDVGIDMSPEFFIALIKGVVAGDVLNALGYRVRPYELEPGATDRAMEASKRLVYEALYRRTNLFVALYKCRKEFEKVAVDRLRARPKVSIIGEFWAMTTEGDGNYRLHKFLQEEGAECDIQLTTAWILYNIWEVARDTRERRDLRVADKANAGLDGMDGFDVSKRLATLRLAELGLRVGFQLFALPTGLFDYHLPDMDLVADVAKDYYNNDLRGGEGHMEVGKLILNTVMSKAHMTVSVKPFGCMPSSGVSDGVQTLVTQRYPGTIYCAVETSGDGAANFYSRVQMFLFKARQLAEAEYTKALEETGLTEEQIRSWLTKNPRYASSLHKAPHVKAGSAADFVYEVAPLMTKSRTERAVISAKKTVAVAQKVARAVPGAVAKAVATLKDDDFRAAVREDVSLIKDLVQGRVKERFAPLMDRLAHRAFFERDPVATHEHHTQPASYAAPVATA